MPIITNTGADFFGFLSEGKPIWAQKKGIFDTSVKIKYDKAANHIEISFNNDSKYLDVDIRSAKIGETYQLIENLAGQSNSSAHLSVFTDLGTTNGIKYDSMNSYYSDNNYPSTFKILYVNESDQAMTGEFDLKLKQYQQNNHQHHQRTL